MNALDLIALLDEPGWAWWLILAFAGLAETVRRRWSADIDARRAVEQVVAAQNTQIAALEDLVAAQSEHIDALKQHHAAEIDDLLAREQRHAARCPWAQATPEEASKS